MPGGTPSVLCQVCLLSRVSLLLVCVDLLDTSRKRATVVAYSASTKDLDRKTKALKTPGLDTLPK